MKDDVRPLENLRTRLRALWSLKTASYAGLVLVVASVPPLRAMAREWLSERRAERRYRVQRIDKSLDALFAGHRISVSDRFRRGERAPGPFVEAPVVITVDGKDYSNPAMLHIGTDFTDAGRYWNYLSMGELVDLEGGASEFFVVQCLPADTPRDYPLSMSWRILFVSSAGVVRDELFAFEQRGDPLYRTLLARLASPAGLGFHSQVLAAWPTVLFPFLYPFASAVLGASLLAARGAVYLLRLRPRPA